MEQNYIINVFGLKNASIGDYMGEHNINFMFLTPVVEHEIINIVNLCKPRL